MPDHSTRYSEWGFEPCEFEPDECDRCRQVAPLFFGDKDDWDGREGYYYCSKCLDERIESDLESIRLEMEDRKNWPVFDFEALTELERKKIEEMWSDDCDDADDE